MIGENMEGFISCIGSGVRGVREPPAMSACYYVILCGDRRHVSSELQVNCVKSRPGKG